MKKIFLTILLAGSLTRVFAQDPQLSGSSVTPIPALVNGQVSYTVTFQNASTLPIKNPDPINNPMSLTISLNKTKPTLDGTGKPVVTGPGSVFFDWVTWCDGTCATDGSSDASDIWTLSGVQIMEIPGQTDPFSSVGGPIYFGGKITAASTSAQALGHNGNGFNANISVGGGGDIDNSIASNVRREYGHTNGVLPVKLVSFKVQREGAVSNVSWVTTEETNADRFEVQRSLNSKDWTSIGEKRAAGESTILISYRFVDSNPLSGSNYYRLKMIDKDGTYTYSRIQSVVFGENTAATHFYPNPASDVLKMIDPASGNVTGVTMVDLKGRAVYQSSSVSPEGINIKGLTSGIYMLKVTYSDGTLNTHKIVVSR